MKRILKLTIALAIIAATGACAHGPKPEPQIKTVEVKVPVPVPCKSTVDVRESYSDAVAETLSDIRDQVAALLQGREERIGDAERMKGAIIGCGGTVK